MDEGIHKIKYIGIELKRNGSEVGERIVEREGGCSVDVVTVMEQKGGFNKKCKNRWNVNLWKNMM